MEYTLYRLYKTKIAFENHCPINAKQLQQTFNDLKFYAIIYFVKCIQDYKNIINYNRIYSETAYKYLFKAFDEWINKKKYKLQIFIYNIYHINVITI